MLCTQETWTPTWPKFWYIYSLLESKMLNWNFAMGGVGWIGWVRVFNPFVPRIHNEICQTPY